MDDDDHDNDDAMKGQNRRFIRRLDESASFDVQSPEERLENALMMAQWAVREGRSALHDLKKGRAH